MAELAKTNIISHVVYDKKTGKVLHTHRSFDVEKGEYRKCTKKEILQFVSSDDSTLIRVTDNDPKNLAVVITEDTPEGAMPGIGGLMVDKKTKAVVQKPKLRLKPKKMELLGNGEDETEIDISVVDRAGKIERSFSGNVKVSTSRGKLSTKGGFVDIKNGKGKISLTSVNETVARVKVAVHGLDETCVRDEIIIEFL